MRYLGTICYVGTNYGGWQIQPDNASIEEEVEKVLSKILNTSIKIYGSGRTDAGVHALKQTFHFDSKEIVDLNRFKYSLNSLLPSDMYVLSLEKVSDDFHARYNVKTKTYSYYINVGAYNPFVVNRMHQLLRKLDVTSIKEALTYLEGEHNFKNFTAKMEDDSNFVRTIYKAYLIEDGDTLKITFVGNGFMRYMVRNIVGVLLEIGLGRQSPTYIKELLEKEDRAIVPFKAPSCGLYLEDVEY